MMRPTRKAKQRALDAHLVHKRRKFRQQEVLPQDCSICLDVVTSRGTLSICDHWFCFPCIYEWSKNTNTCPLCKIRFRCITKVSINQFGSPPQKFRIKDKNISIVNYYEDDYEVAMGLLEETREEEITYIDNNDFDETFSPRRQSSVRRSTLRLRAIPTQNQYMNRLRVRSRIGESISEPVHPTQESPHNMESNETIELSTIDVESGNEQTERIEHSATDVDSGNDQMERIERGTNVVVDGAGEEEAMNFSFTNGSSSGPLGRKRQKKRKCITFEGHHRHARSTARPAVNSTGWIDMSRKKSLRSNISPSATSTCSTKSESPAPFSQNVTRAGAVLPRVRLNRPTNKKMDSTDGILSNDGTGKEESDASDTEIDTMHECSEPRNNRLSLPRAVKSRCTCHQSNNFRLIDVRENENDADYTYETDDNDEYLSSDNSAPALNRRTSLPRAVKSQYTSNRNCTGLNKFGVVDNITDTDDDDNEYGSFNALTVSRSSLPRLAKSRRLSNETKNKRNISTRVSQSSLGDITSNTKNNSSQRGPSLFAHFSGPGCVDNCKRRQRRRYNLNDFLSSDIDDDVDDEDEFDDDSSTICSSICDSVIPVPDMEDEGIKINDILFEVENKSICIDTQQKHISLGSPLLTKSAAMCNNRFGADMPSTVLPSFHRIDKDVSFDFLESSTISFPETISPCVVVRDNTHVTMKKLSASHSNQSNFLTRSACKSTPITSVNNKTSIALTHNLRMTPNKGRNLCTYYGTRTRSPLNTLHCNSNSIIDTTPEKTTLIRKKWLFRR